MSIPSEPSSPTLPTPPAIEPPVRARLQKIWKKAYAAETREDLVDLYAEWSATYDEDHAAIGYFGHRTTAELFARQIDNRANAAVLDAGAGTGAGGCELARLGFRNLTALDLSAEMLTQARRKGIFRELYQADLGGPLDAFENDRFDGVILVGVFSYGQAPACALDEILRVTRPGGMIALTLRTDFFDDDAMGVRSKMEQLKRDGAWRLREISEPAPYLPGKDPDVLFRVWTYQALAGKRPAPSADFAGAVRRALLTPAPIKTLDHSHIWDPMASRLYEAYIASADYYLTACETEVLCIHAEQIATESSLFVELGCGSADKIKILCDAALEAGCPEIAYQPIDISPGALQATREELAATYQDRIRIEPWCGRFGEQLSRIPADRGKNIFFFGSSIGNLATPAATAAFLGELREVMTPLDQLVIGFDLQKNPEVLLRAYNAGPANLSFFVHMVRRMNHLLGANFDLTAFRLGSTYDVEPPWRGLETRCVNLKVVTEKPQDVHLPALGLDVHLDAGDAIQVGTSRKFRTDDIRLLAAYAGLRLRTLWLDSRHYFAVSELVRDDAPLPENAPASGQGDAA